LPNLGIDGEVAGRDASIVTVPADLGVPLVVARASLSGCLIVRDCLSSPIVSAEPANSGMGRASAGPKWTVAGIPAIVSVGYIGQQFTDASDAIGEAFSPPSIGRRLTTILPAATPDAIFPAD
jgi:hypothetical protein